MRAVQASENSGKEGSRIYRACDLPVYIKDIQEEEQPSKCIYPRNGIEEQIGNIRRGFQDFFGQYKETYNRAKQTVETGVAHSKSTLDFVQNNPGELPRVAFITVGSLGGFIFGYRGGILRKLFYGSVAGMSCAALCYPQFTVDLSRQAGEYVTQQWQDFNMEEMKKGNWPFVKEESVDEENRKKLGLPQNIVNEVLNIESQNPVVKKVKGDPGQANPADKDMYSTRSS
ncbi:micos complex subunit [Plakobranchus ocellatus]|uniref:MICOS complex subunit n=1 Tax=Plakobranchus ocellatus TaxID=259542 RepID=A0AAV4DLI6_9GAST|nr:micos complex subunit [Plakobranchus ocellatus]